MHMRVLLSPASVWSLPQPQVLRLVFIDACCSEGCPLGTCASHCAVTFEVQGSITVCQCLATLHKYGPIQMKFKHPTGHAQETFSRAINQPHDATFGQERSLRDVPQYSMRPGRSRGLRRAPQGEHTESATCTSCVRSSMMLALEDAKVGLLFDANVKKHITTFVFQF